MKQLALLLGGLLGVNAYADENDWNNSSGGFLYDDLNWHGGESPCWTDDAMFDLDGTYNLGCSDSLRLIICRSFVLFGFTPGGRELFFVQRNADTVGPAARPGSRVFILCRYQD